MFKKLAALVIVLAFVGVVAGCSGDKAGDVCNLLYNKITSACDLSDPTEAAIVAGGLSQAWGETISAAEVTASSKDDFTTECEAGYEDELSGFTGEQKDALIDAQMDAINDITTTDCTTMMSSLGAALYLL